MFFLIHLVIILLDDGDCRTQGGIFTTPGEAYTTPVEMWLKGLGKFIVATHSLLLPKRNQIFLPWFARFGNVLMYVYLG